MRSRTRGVEKGGIQEPRTCFLASEVTAGRIGVGGLARVLRAGTLEGQLIAGWPLTTASPQASYRSQ